MFRCVECKALLSQEDLVNTKESYEYWGTPIEESFLTCPCGGYIENIKCCDCGEYCEDKDDILCKECKIEIEELYNKVKDNWENSFNKSIDSFNKMLDIEAKNLTSSQKEYLYNL